MHKEDFLQKCGPARAAREYESNTYGLAAGNAEPATLTAPGSLLEMQPASPVHPQTSWNKFQILTRSSDDLYIYIEN